MPQPAKRLGLAILLAALAMLGPFSVDAYLPAFPAIGSSLRASPFEVQQSLTVYLLSFAAMMLWHGTLSDAVGRRPVILVSLVVFFLASFGSIFSTGINEFLVYRALQGFSAGAGVVVGRAMVRDLYSGPDAQRLMSTVTMIFGLGPAIAPIMGGFLFKLFGWPSIFIFITVYGGALLGVCWFALPETLPRDKRQPLRPVLMLSNFGRVFRRREFRLLCLAVAFNFAGLMLYVGSAPVLILEHLKLGPESFAVFFVPVVIGIILGSFLSGRLAGKVAAEKVVAAGYGVMLSGAAANVTFHALFPPTVPWSILPLILHTFGMSMAMPNITLRILDLFPSIRGLVASVQGFTQTALNGLVAGLLAPVVFHSTLLLALTHAACLAIGLAGWIAYLLTRQQPAGGAG